MQSSDIRTLREFGRDGASIVVLTGAGISAESGIPTFRGPEGYWTPGSQVYRPEELATRRFFEEEPEIFWRWYLFRLGICRDARPNAAHVALVDLERRHCGAFHLITQNVDGLHRRAGTADEVLYEIHGRIALVRCSRECGLGLHPLPEGLAVKDESRPLPEEVLARLRCPRCGAWTRPHVLLFDECYDEEHFFYDSALRTTASANLFIVIGTTGATTLPMLLLDKAMRVGATVIDVNPDDNVFGQAARRSSHGFACRGPATDWVPKIVSALIGDS